MKQLIKTIILNLIFLNVVSAQKKTNIILILADDLGWADLGCYGNEYFKTPNIDKLAKGGKKFTQAYASAPVCSPSRAGLLTGSYPARLKFTQYAEGAKGDTNSNILPAKFNPELSPKHSNIASELKKSGYTTAMIGKWHLGKADSSQPMKMGFDYERVADNGITYYNFKLKENNKVVYEAKDNEYLTDKLTDEAIGFIEKNKEKPFFLYLSHFAPHLLLQPKPQKIPMYFYMYNKLSKGKFDPYYGATIESLDDAVGVLLKKLDELKLLDNTLIVFTSDNGGLTAREFGTKPTDNSPLREGKGWLYEGGIRVPFIVYQKGVTDSMTVSNEPVTNLDFYPTFIEIASGKSPEKFDGKSINHLFDSKTKPSKIGEKPMFWHYPHFSNQGGRPSSIVRLGNLKLIYFYESKTYELYDLARDESETKNLIPEQPEVFEKLKSMLQNWLSSTSAVLPTPNLKK